MGKCKINKYKICECVAYAVFIIAVCVCIFFIVSCYKSFSSTTKAFQRETTTAMATITSAAEQTAISASTQPSNNTAATINNNIETSDESISNLITHMESMVEIQKNGMTNDLMSFIYGIMSTILVGLCAGFVLKSRNNADEAQKKVNIANAAAKKASTSAKDAESSANQVKESANRINELNDKMQIALESFNQESTRQSIIMMNTIKIIRIQNIIALAEVVLLDMDQIEANRRIYDIKKEVESLFYKEELNSETFDSNSVQQLYIELMRLKSRINDFKDGIEEKYGSSDNEEDKGKLVSLQQSAENYIEWIDEAIIACEGVIEPKT